MRFREAPERIVNQSRATVDSELVGRIDPSLPPNFLDPLTAGLQVKSGKTLALVGGDIFLEGGNLTANEGRIELGSLGDNSFVNINSTEQGLTLSYEEVNNFKDIVFSPRTIVDVSGETGGEIQLQGRNVALNGDQRFSPVLIFSNTVGTGQGGTVTISASEEVELSGNFSILLTRTDGAGSASDLIINSEKLTLRDGGLIQSSGSTFNNGQAGDITINADSVEVIGTTLDGFPRPTAIATFGITGNGGNLSIETEQLAIEDGGQISASTFGQGNAGNVSIISKSVNLRGTLPDGRPSAIGATVEGEATGDGGNLVIETEQITVLDGAQISTVARNDGQGGELTINASDSIILDGFSPFDIPEGNRSGVFVSAEPGAISNGGTLNINTEQLIVENGARISADNFGTGEGGNATLNVDNLIVRNGGEIGAGSLLEPNFVDKERGAGGTLTINATESIEVTGTGDINGEPVKSSLFTLAEGTGDAGDLTLTTNKLTVSDGGEINASATGTGAAGDLTITAKSLELNRGTLTATTAAGIGGNINLDIDEIITLENNSLISAAATGTANGGNINIDTDFIVASPNQNSDILASAGQQGAGGRIVIDAEGIFGIEERPQNPITNDIDASGGTDGEVIINTPDVDISKGVIETPQRVVAPEQIVARACSPDGIARGSSSLIVNGKGGVPPQTYCTH